METIKDLEKEFSNLIHVVSNKNLSIQIMNDNLVCAQEEEHIKITRDAIKEKTVEIARAMISFKKAFIKFRDNGYK